jgi:uncharacterized protein YdaT
MDKQQDNEEIETSVNASRKCVYRVIYSKDLHKWQIRKDNADRVIDSKVTKEEAINRVKELSAGNDAGYVVYKKDGKFQKK